MKKNILFILLLLYSLCGYSNDVIDGISYSLNSENKTASVESKSGGYTGDIVIPESVEYDGEAYPVTSIYKDAFKNCSGLTSLTIPNSVTSIGKNAFKNCSGLTSVTIGNGVTEIGDGAFAGCSGLTSVTLNNNNFVSGEWGKSPRIMLYFGIQVEKCILGEDVTSIGDGTFRGCSNLISVTIPNSVTSIGSEAFRRCSSLTSVNIPNSVTSIGSYAFGECSSLTSLTIPNGVTSIALNTFDGCSSLTSITIPNSVTSIGRRAFRNCSNLTSVTIPNVTLIDWQAFMYCSSLTSLTIPNITSIGHRAFWDCSGLTSVNIGNSITSIGEMAFHGCSRLSSVTIGNDVKIINKLSGGASGSFEGTGFYGGSSHMYCYSDAAVEILFNEDMKGLNSALYFNHNDHLYVPASSLNVDTQSFIILFKIISPLTQEEMDNYSTDINAIVTTDEGAYQIYTIEGKPVDGLQKGVNIIRYSDGQTKKVYNPF